MGKGELSAEELLKLANSASGKDPNALLGAVEKRLPQEKKNELFRILGDKKALEELLRSEQAQKLMKQFKK